MSTAVPGGNCSKFLKLCCSEVDDDGTKSGEWPYLETFMHTSLW